MLPLAYLVSQFPEAHESFIVREIQAVAQSAEVSLTIFSLKPCRDRIIQEEARPFIERTRYPSLRGDMRGIWGLFSTRGARDCLREVLNAYRARPTALGKAVATMVRAAALAPRLRQLGSPHLHAHWATMPALAAYFLRSAAGFRYSITAHAWDIYTDTTMLRQKMDGAEFVVTCTAANREYLRATIGSTTPILLSYHGLDFARVPAPKFERASRLSILAVGRLVEQKGFAHLVEACSLLQQKGRGFSCRIIGEGPLRESLASEIESRALGERVSLSGAKPLSEVFAALREASALCVPSVVASDGDRDGIPNVIIEAMSQGVPVVASSVSGIPEIVRDGSSGWLVSPGDVPGLARALEDVVDRADEARRRAEVAHGLVRDQFDAPRNAELLLQQFHRVAEASREGSHEVGDGSAQRP